MGAALHGQRTTKVRGLRGLGVDSGESDEPVRVDRFNAERRTMESCTQYGTYIFACTCSRTGKEMEATAIWQEVGGQGGGGVC